MKTKFKFLMAAATLAVGFSGCSDNVEGIDAPKGDETTMTLTIPMVKTYATHPGIEVESDFTTADVYIFNGTKLESTVSFSKDDFEDTDSAWKLKSPIPTTTGSKYIYVGLNLPGEKSKIDDGIYSVLDVDYKAVSKANEFSMFSVNTEQNTSFVVDADASKNNFKITVERWAAKVIAREKDGLVKDVDKAGAVFKDLSFCLGNINKKMFAMQKQSSNLIVDPNWEGFNKGNYDRTDFVSEFGNNADIKHGAYAILNVETESVDDSRSKFALENTSKEHKQGEVTYISVRGTFNPKNYSTYVDGKHDIIPNTETKAADLLYVIKTVEGVLFFKDEAQAKNYATKVLNKDEKAVLTYKDGYSYFFIWLDAKVEGNIHPTLRNHIFDAKVTEINALGAPNPEPEDPNKPTPTETDMTVELTIKDWELITSEHSLGD